MRARIQKWGNSLAMRIPKALTSELGLKDGSDVELSLEAGELKVRPLPGPAFTIGELLRGVTPENVPQEWDVGGPVGGEAW